MNQQVITQMDKDAGVQNHSILMCSLIPMRVKMNQFNDYKNKANSTQIECVDMTSILTESMRLRLMDLFMLGQASQKRLMYLIENKSQLDTLRALGYKIAVRDGVQIEGYPEGCWVSGIQMSDQVLSAFDVLKDPVLKDKIKVGYCKNDFYNVAGKIPDLTGVVLQTKARVNQGGQIKLKSALMHQYQDQLMLAFKRSKKELEKKPFDQFAGVLVEHHIELKEGKKDAHQALVWINYHVPVFLKKQPQVIGCYKVFRQSRQLSISACVQSLYTFAQQPREGSFQETVEQLGQQMTVSVDEQKVQVSMPQSVPDQGLAIEGVLMNAFVKYINEQLNIWVMEQSKKLMPIDLETKLNEESFMGLLRPLLEQQRGLQYGRVGSALDNEDTGWKQTLLQLKKQQLNQLTDQQDIALYEDILNEAKRRLMQKSTDTLSLDQAWLVKVVHEKVLTICEHNCSQKTLQSMRKRLQIEKYQDFFPAARAINRQITYHLGPTNSGKTYNALLDLQKAKSGIYLAPLRLLALEIYERLSQEGIVCNLLTGEEHIEYPGATHVACTIEMLNTNKHYECALIDEIQMLSDDSRGSAWTRALVGVAAKRVHVAGAIEFKGVLQKVAGSILNTDTHEFKDYKRLVPLKVSDKSNQPSAGDAWVAFSRKRVLEMSHEMKQLGFAVSVIYGQLSPEVRRAEAKKFIEGQTQILCATDAIGMGLNLPVLRVMFDSIEKFDGIEQRKLNGTEIKQIAGRAGRFGKYPVGYYGAKNVSDINYLTKRLENPAPISEDFRLQVAPTEGQISLISQTLNTQSIHEILMYYAHQLLVDHPLLQTSKLKDSIENALIVDGWMPNDYPVLEKFALSMCPVSVGRMEEISYYKTCLKALKRGTVMAAPSESLIKKNNAGLVLGPEELSEGEVLTKQIGIYTWFSYKYPEIFIDQQKIPELRKKVNEWVSECLAYGVGLKMGKRLPRKQG